jgi:hypothetical protein
MTKQKVTQYETILCGLYDSCEISEVIHKLKHYRSQGFTGLEMDKEWYPYDSEPTIILKVSKQRLETSEEYKERLEKEEFNKESRRKTYEILKKEFDP